jgi:inosine triphosphate pyrophosphatase
MALYFITGNSKKFAEVKAILPEVEQMEMDLEEIQELDAHKIIAAKLFQARSTLRHSSTLMVEDTSLYLDALGGLPGPFIKWFLMTAGSKGLYSMARTFNNFNATAKTIIGYVGEDGEIEFFEGESKGTIVEEQIEPQFGWDAIFLPEGSAKTYGELSLEEKNAVSQRGKALAKLKLHLTKKESY